MSTDAVRDALAELVAALDNAFISSWQTTSGWDLQLSRAREVLARAVLAQPAPSGGVLTSLPRRGLIVLKNVVQLLREQASFVDEEGEDTNALDELLTALTAAPSPSTPPTPSWAMRTREALELIAAPKRPDGTWNRDREACRQIAADALGMIAAQEKTS